MNLRSIFLWHLTHAQYQFDDRVPETKEAFGEITVFFDKHLGR
jgi:hypothetical protein